MKISKSALLSLNHLKNSTDSHKIKSYGILVKLSSF